MNTEVIEQILQQAGALYVKAPADSLRLTDEAQALLAADAPALLHARVLRTRGLALGYLGRFEEALAALKAALEWVPDDALTAQIETVRAHAIVYETLGALEESLAWAVRSEALARQLGDTRRLADTRLSVAVARSRAGDTAGGLQDYLEALGMYESLADEFGCLQVLNNIGISCKNLGRFDEAVVHIERSIALARSRGDEGMLAIAMANLGEPLWKLGRLDEARAVMEEAAARLHEAGVVSGEIHSRILLGRVLVECGGPALPRAQTELERALALCRQTGNRNHLARAHLALAELHKAAGRFEQALAEHEAYHAAERAQFNDESARRLRALQVRSDLARAQHEADAQRLRAAEMAMQSRTDVLTGLANRRHFDERLAQELSRARRQGHTLAAALIDIDDFKRINDRLGHAVGDEVLRRVAPLLRRHCRDVDLVARYGGEEFVALFVEADAATALRACEAMRQAVAAENWAAVDPALQVTLSAGLATLDADDDASALLRAADHRLYEAKQSGKNRVCAPPGAA